jgi:phosphate:Na+ symporter
MEILLSILKLLAGVGLFLFAMYLLEQSLKELSGRNFKLLLKKFTKNKVGSVFGGIIVTGILQSSSMVSLLVLAFVSAGVFTVKNALAIILGANFGATFGNWFVATIGFKFNLEIVAYPAVCVAGILIVLYNNQKTIKNISYLLFGFGLLFIALSFMKTAMDEQVKTFSFNNYKDLEPITFLLIGFVLTLVVQSSSVTMALALTAINAGAISVIAGASIVLGSETGTTIKMLLGAIGGSALKKRIVFGNFLFNVCLTIIAFTFLKAILYFITNILSINDPLIILVAFSSVVNFISIIIFLPFLDYFVSLLQILFKDTTNSITAFISNINGSDSDIALELFKKETAYFIYSCMVFNLSLFNADTKTFYQNADYKKINDKSKFFEKFSDEKYEFLKKMQGELQILYVDLRFKLQGENNLLINRLISAVRSAMYSVKSMKDIASNISNLQNSSKDIKFEYFMEHKKEVQKLYDVLNSYMYQQVNGDFEALKNVFNDIESNYTLSLNNFYTKAQTVSLLDLDITTAINFNRELFTSNKALLMAVKDFLLDEKQAEQFNEIPIYKS